MLDMLEKKAASAYVQARRYHNAIGLAAFVFGFLFDILTLVRVDRLYEQVSIGAYMCVGTILLVYISFSERRGYEVSPVVFSCLQFVLGALVGGFLVLYGRSATLQGSGFFLTGIALLLVCNELFRARYRTVLFRYSVWLVVCIAYMTMMLPLAYGRLGEDVFMHGLITAAFCGFGVLTLFRAMRVLTHARDFALGCLLTVLLLALFWVSYYTHSIPPVPLSLQSMVLAHDVSKEGDVYTVAYEQASFFARMLLRESSDTFLVSSTETDINGDVRVYCFSQIYAPAKLSSPLRHVWERYDEVQATWLPLATIPFSIQGGRRAGYRAYSYITLHASAGAASTYGTSYRCAVETEEGFLVGRRTMQVLWGTPTTTEVLY